MAHEGQDFNGGGHSNDNEGVPDEQQAVSDARIAVTEWRIGMEMVRDGRLDCYFAALGPNTEGILVDEGNVDRHLAALSNIFGGCFPDLFED